MSSKDGKKLSQAELLEQLSEPVFNQSRDVPKDAIIHHSPEERWWRSDSPRGHDEDCPDGAPEYSGDPNLNQTAGSIGYGRREGPRNFMTASQTGSGTAAHFKNDPAHPASISGFSGHFPGRSASNVIGATYDRNLEESLAHTIALGK
eukprot:TRINITY_DN485_c0_g2_i1.p1 TRINITY_DN485_c0_g2~~TRINITY_DN485_c0_g2_i1.p1  ORF type:complete len:148 (-),score=24.86 TRINITY_DN485_c0_g2_i1:204-647(-)